MFPLELFLLLLYSKAHAKEQTSLFVSIAVLDPHIPERMMIGKDVAVTIAMHLAPDYTPKEVRFHYTYNGSMDLPVDWVEMKGFAPNGDGWAEVTIEFNSDLVLHKASSMIANSSHGDVHYDLEMDNHAVFLKIRMVSMESMESKEAEANSHYVSSSKGSLGNVSIMIRERQSEREKAETKARDVLPSSYHTGNSSLNRLEEKLQNITRKKKDLYVEAVLQLLHQQKHQLSWKFLLIYAIVSSTFLLLVLSFTILLLFFWSWDDKHEATFARSKPGKRRHRPIEV